MMKKYLLIHRDFLDVAFNETLKKHTKVFMITSDCLVVLEKHRKLEKRKNKTTFVFNFITVSFICF